MTVWNSTLKRHKPLTPKKPIRRHSIKWLKAEYQLRKLTNYLKLYRADGKCELCLNDKGLQGAHIKNKGNGRQDTAGNILIACHKCHRHDVFKKGLPISQEEAIELVRKRNKYFNIPDDLTGGDLPKKEL